MIWDQPLSMWIDTQYFSAKSMDGRCFQCHKVWHMAQKCSKKVSKYKTSASFISPGKMETKLYQSSLFMLIGCYALPSWIQGALALYWVQSFVGLDPKKMLKWLQYMGESTYFLQSWHCWDLHRSWQQCWNWYTDSAQEGTRFWSTTWDQCHQSTRGGVCITHTGNVKFNERVPICAVLWFRFLCRIWRAAHCLYCNVEMDSRPWIHVIDT